MLIELGAVTDCVTFRRQETPLLLAMKRDQLTPDDNYCRDNCTDASLEIVRTLVEKGNIDPMRVDDIGYTAVTAATGQASQKALSWLLRQDIYDIDLRYTSSAGHTTAAYICTTEDFSADLLDHLLESGIGINDPCVRTWYLRFGPKFPRIRGKD